LLYDHVKNYSQCKTELSESLNSWLVYFSVTESRQIDEVYYLQSYREGWTDGKWEEKMDERECIEQNSFVEVCILI